MKRNTASQIIGAQLNSKTDGSAVTSGTTTAFVTGDGGVQAAGSVGAGACTHEGNGFWTYTPAQAETDFAHVAFTFVNTSAVTPTVQVFPSFPQTADVAAGVIVTTNNDKTGYRLSALGIDDVWDELIAAHLGAGSTGKALNDATSAGNPWNSVAEGTLTFGDLVRILTGVAVGKTDIIDNGNGTAHVEFRDASDLSLIVAADMTGSERTAVALTP